MPDIRSVVKAKLCRNRHLIAAPLTLSVCNTAVVNTNPRTVTICLDKGVGVVGGANYKQSPLHNNNVMA